MFDIAPVTSSGDTSVATPVIDTGSQLESFPIAHEVLVQFALRIRLKSSRQQRLTLGYPRVFSTQNREIITSLASEVSLVGWPGSNWRRGLANLIVYGHRFVMCAVFFVPIAVIFRLLVDENPWVALLTGGLMVAGFIGAIKFVPRMLSVSAPPARRGTASWAFLRSYRMFVGNGDASQALARRIDPLWQNPYPCRTPYETAVWLASVEVIHWALFAASAAPVTAALWYGHSIVGFVCLTLSVLFNFLPNLVIRDTRLRLYRLIGRTRAAGSSTPAAEVSDAVVPTGGPGAEPGAPAFGGRDAGFSEFTSSERGRRC